MNKIFQVKKLLQSTAFRIITSTKLLDINSSNDTRQGQGKINNNNDNKNYEKNTL
jgi:hypothetical protein